MEVIPFSPLEIQLVRASLTTKTTEQIAELVERSMPDIIALINDITDGKAGERDLDVKLYLEEQSRQKKIKTGRPKKTGLAIATDKKKKQENESIDLLRKNKRMETERAWELQRKAHSKRTDQRKFKTRAIDFSKLISVKLDDKTWAQIDPQETKEKTQELIEKVKAHYEANKTLNKYKHNITEN